MKKIFLLAITCLALIANSAEAQNPNTKWGKPSQTEWSLQAWGEAPDAEAVVLNKTMELTYRIARQFQSYSGAETGVSLSNIEGIGSSENRNILATYAVKLRTKILKDSGAKYANIDIIYFNMEDDLKMYDEFESFKVTVFSQNDKGKVQKRTVKPSNIVDERYDKNYKVRHVTIPDVKAGDIIEYQYDLISSRITYLYDCSFQEDIPVLYALCDMNIPGMVQFNMTTPVHPFIKSKVDVSSINGEQAAGDMGAPIRYPSNHYVIEGHDILPKGLDLQRQGADTEAAKVGSKPGEAFKMLGILRDQRIAQPAPISGGKGHIVINP